MEIVSIIIATYNSEKTIENSVKSVLNQDYKNIELIIVDGSSTDNTINILKKFKNIICISEKDNGVYDAFNKGIKIAKGNWLYFLGSDDVLYKNDVITKVFANKNLNNVDIILGKILFDSSRIHNSFFNWSLFFRNSTHHQSCFYKKSNFKNFEYDTSFKISSDYELNLRMYLKKRRALHVNYIIADVSTQGISGRVNFKGYSEFIMILRRNVQHYYLLIFPVILLYLFKRIYKHKVNFK